MDVYSEYFDPAIQKVCLERMFIVLIHYGCTTGVGQVNDTDCHCALERSYIEAETLAFSEQQLIDLGDISRSREDVVTDLAEVWRNLPHKESVEGHWRIGLSNALDGSEDDRLARDAGTFWHELQMSNLRAREAKYIRSQVMKGQLSWKSVYDVVQHPTDLGIMREGQEMEGEMGDGVAWEDGSLESKIHANCQDEDGDAPSDVDVCAEPSDDPEEVVGAQRGAECLAFLNRICADAKTANMPSISWQADKRIRQLKKHNSHRLGECQQNNVLRRYHRCQSRASPLTIRSKCNTVVL